jgi:hypothetical protein
MNQPATQSQNILLSAPVIRAGQRIDSVSIRQVRTADLIGIKLSELVVSDVNALIQVLPRCTVPALTEDEVSFLPASDLVQLANVLCLQLMTPAAEGEGVQHEGVLQ